MKHSIYLLIIVLFFKNFSLSAQESHEVVVTRDYRPDVATFSKLNFEPRELDSAALRPDMEYSITPIALILQTPLYIIAPEQIDIMQRILSYPFYIRAGGGYRPIRSLFDFNCFSKNRIILFLSL